MIAKVILFCILGVFFTMLPSVAVAKEPLRIGITSSGPMASLEHLPLLAAQQEGYFKEAGVDIQLVEFTSWQERDEALREGKVDGAFIGYVEALLLKNSGVNIKLTTRCSSHYSIVVGKPTLSSAETKMRYPSQFSGKRVGIIPGSTLEYVWQFWSEPLQGEIREGKPPVKVELDTSRYGADSLDAVDAIVLPPLAALDAEDSNKGTITATTLNKVSGLAFTQQALDEKDEQILAMFLAYNKGVRFLRDKVVFGKLDFMANKIKNADETFLPEFERAMPMGELISVAKWLSEQGLLATGFDYTTLEEPRYYLYYGPYDTE